MYTFGLPIKIFQLDDDYKVLSCFSTLCFSLCGVVMLNTHHILSIDERNGLQVCWLKNSAFILCSWYYKSIWSLLWSSFIVEKFIANFLLYIDQLCHENLKSRKVIFFFFFINSLFYLLRHDCIDLDNALQIVNDSVRDKRKTSRLFAQLSVENKGKNPFINIHISNNLYTIFRPALCRSSSGLKWKRLRKSCFDVVKYWRHCNVFSWMFVSIGFQKPVDIYWLHWIVLIAAMVTLVTSAEAGSQSFLFLTNVMIWASNTIYFLSYFFVCEF